MCGIQRDAAAGRLAGLIYDIERSPGKNIHGAVMRFLSLSVHLPSAIRASSRPDDRRCNQVGNFCAYPRKSVPQIGVPESFSGILAVSMNLAQLSTATTPSKIPTAAPESSLVLATLALLTRLLDVSGTSVLSVAAVFSLLLERGKRGNRRNYR